ENVGKHIIAYETQTGRRLWSLEGEFTAAAVAPDGTVYGVVSAGMIYGDHTVLVDKAGHITKTASAAGCDIALDSAHQAVWLVGKTIKKCDLDLNVLHEIKPVKWCAVSVDVCPDGSIWVAEREHPNVAQSADRILKISADGQIVKTIPLEWSPLCLRVD